MEIEYRQNSGSQTLLIFLAGWGTTPEVVRHYELPEGWDYLSIYDYKGIVEQIATDTFSTLNVQHYDHVYLVAWSMGVWAAEILHNYLPNPEIAIAVTGTPLPMHDLYGIPDQIFKGTLEGLSDDNRARFNRRMCGGKRLLSVYESFSARSTKDLREELLYVFKYSNDAQGTKYPWTRAVIGERDLIIPPPNQLRYWDEQHVPTQLLIGVGHYPFFEFNSWQELLHNI